MQNKVIYFIAIALIIGLGIGFFLGQMNGKKIGTAQTETKYAPIVDAAFPPPPAEMIVLSGVVKSTYGATIVIEINDPDDYLPHADGSLRAKQTRTVNVLGNTTYATVNFGKFDKQGNPTRTPITFNDIKTGDTVTVHAATNIKTAQTFNATAVEVVEY